MQQRPRSAPFLVVMLVASLVTLQGHPVGSTVASAEGEEWSLLVAKADPALRVALDDGTMDTLPVLVTGPSHPPVKTADRQAALDAWTGMSAPFFDAVAAVVAEGGSVSTTWPAAHTLKVVATPAILQDIATMEQVRHLTLDHYGAVTVSDASGAPGAANSGGRSMLEADEAWAAGHRGEGVVFAVTGTGIDPAHEAFRFADGSSRVSAWAYCPSTGCVANGSPQDPHGHSTFMAATAVGSDHYDDPVWGRFQETGVAPDATLIASAFLDSTGAGTFEGAMLSLQWSFDNGADVSSNSWGASCPSSTAVVQLITALRDAGMVSVFPIGSGAAPSGPACGRAAVATAAVDEGYVRFGTTRGPCTDPVSGIVHTCPDFVTKGVSVRSAVPRDGQSFGDPSGYRTISGQSPSAAFMAGALVIAEEMKRAFTGTGWDTANESEKAIHRATALPLPSGGPQPNDDYGWGHPKLMGVLATFTAPPEAVIVPVFGVSSSSLEDGGSTRLLFSVRNMGTAVATGTFTASLERPDGTTITLADRSVALGLMDTARVEETFVALAGTQSGTYTFRAAFDHAWTNGTTGEVVHDVVGGEGTFTVYRPVLTLRLEGLEDEVWPLEHQEVRFTLGNIGNLAARGTTVDWTFPDAYFVLPGAAWDPRDAGSRYSDPAPDAVHEDPRFARTTLSWDVGDLVPGAEWTFDMSLMPTEPGTHSFVVVVEHEDGRAGEVFRQRVVLPP